MKSEEGSDVLALFNFLTLCQKLKQVMRFEGQVFWRTYPIDGYESVADHTWRMALMLVIIHRKLAKSIDLERALKMAVIHDLPEMICGDPSPLGTDGTGQDSHAYNQQAKQDKYEAELQAAEQLFAMLPAEVGSELLSIWKEFEEQKSFEAKVVTAIDKFEGKLQAHEYTKNIKMDPRHLHFTMTYGVEYFAEDLLLEELGKHLIDELNETQTNL